MATHPPCSEESDQALIHAYVEHGSEQAFAQLTRRYHGMAFSTALRICGDHTEAEDILQQSFSVLAKKAVGLSEVKSLGAWLHRVVTLESHKALRKNTRRRIRETNAYETETISSEGQTLAKKIAPILDESLNALNQSDRSILTQHYLEGHTFKSIARTSGDTADALQKRSVRALEKLAAKLKHRGVAVSGVALGVILTSSQLKAGISSSLLSQITHKALKNPPTNTTILLTMKTGIIICIISGTVFSAGWGYVSKRVSETPVKLSSNPSRHSQNSRQISHRREVFSIELIEHMVEQYDHSEEIDPFVETRLRSLIFTISKVDLHPVLQILLKTKHTHKFQPAAAALFARWAEIDPVQAVDTAKEAGVFSHQARRGAVVTWLHIDHEAAIEVILEKKTKDDLHFLSEYLLFQAEISPREAAVVMDLVAPRWKKADQRLFLQIADHWSRVDPDSAGEWVASHPNGKERLRVLRYLAGKVAKLRGFDGLRLADRIQDPKARAEARNHAIRWWGITTGGKSLTPEKARPCRDLSEGFPDDWTYENIRMFSTALMLNYKEDFPKLLKLAKNDTQRNGIYEGIIMGSGFSDPTMAIRAVDSLPDSIAQSKQGTHTLQVFITSWHRLDAKAATTWLQRLPEGPKRTIMTQQLNKKETTP